jgi:hypothetical protein
VIGDSAAEDGHGEDGHGEGNLRDDAKLSFPWSDSFSRHFANQERSSEDSVCAQEFEKGAVHEYPSFLFVADIVPSAIEGPEAAAEIP